MRIYTSITLSMETSEIIESQSFEYTGQLALCKGGGGGGGGSMSGKVEHPSYISSRVQYGLGALWDTHLFFGDGDAIPASVAPTGGYIYEAQRNNPYTIDGTTDGTVIPVYDPTPLNGIIEDRFNIFDQIVSNLDYSTDWGAMFDQATGKFSTLFDETEIADRVTAFTDRQDFNRAKAVTRFAGGMSELGAVNQTGFALGMALIEAENQANIADFESELIRQDRVNKVQFAAQSVGQMLQLQMGQVEINKAAVQLVEEISRFRMVSTTETDREQVTYDRSARLWGVELFQPLGNFVASPGGGVMTPHSSQPQTHSSSNSALFGAAGGAIGGVGLALATGMTGGLALAGAGLLGGGVGALGGLSGN